MKKIILSLLITIQVFILTLNIVQAKDIDILEIKNTITENSNISDDFKLLGLDIENYPSLYLEYEQVKLDTDKYHYDRYNDDVENDNYLEGINPAFYYDKWYCVGIAETYDDNMEFIDLYVYLYNPYATTYNSFARYVDEEKKVSFYLDLNITTRSLETSLEVEQSKTYHGVSQLNSASQFISYDNSSNKILNKPVSGDSFQNQYNPFQVIHLSKVGKLADNRFRQYTFKALEINTQTICTDKLNAYFQTKYNSDNNTLISVDYDYDSTMVITEDRIVNLTLDWGKLDKDTISRMAVIGFGGLIGTGVDFIATENQYASMSLFFYNFNSNRTFDEVVSINFEYKLYHYHVKDWWVKDKNHLPDDYESVKRVIKPSELTIEWGVDDGDVWGSNNKKQQGKFETIVSSDVKNKRVSELKPYYEEINNYSNEFNYQASILFDYKPYAYSTEYWGAKAKWDYYNVSEVSVGEMVCKYQGQLIKYKVIDDVNDNDNINLPIAPVDKDDDSKLNIFVVVALVIAGLLLLFVLIKFAPILVPVIKFIGKAIKALILIIIAPIKAVFKAIFHKRE